MSKKPTILIVDDEKNTREGLARALTRQYHVLLAEHGEKALSLLEENTVDVVLSDIRMPGMDGLTLIQRILARAPQPICILLTAYGSIETAVEAMKRGAYHFLTKPVNLDELDLLLKRAMETRRMQQENRNLHEQLDKKFGLESIIGHSAPMQEVFEIIRQVAPARTTVLIQGESGTGKEMVAQAIHHLSPRAQQPFVAVHCAAFSQTLVESELFGHEKGAFTGAEERRKGRFELADGGSLFLDEISEIEPAVQVKILRVLEERRFERVGGADTIDVDVRLIAATNRHLEQMVSEKTFREDLYYRLHVVVINMPPLRDRKDDIPLLAQSFLRDFACENNRVVDGFTAEAMDTLLAYSWPGNVRELRNVVERMVVLSSHERLTVNDIPTSVRKATAVPLGVASAPTPAPASSLSLDEAEKQLIINALRANNNHRTKAAAQLGISRRTLHRKLNEYGLRHH
ncbi:MAG: sigma-54-dependent Fis family transcriptional regulator [Spartobacteria bacterium]|nr:sigma-54-dependent Fis family transcriptional regulator [Spartobacteria bacterium]